MHFFSSALPYLMHIEQPLETIPPPHVVVGGVAKAIRLAAYRACERFRVMCIVKQKII